MFKKKSLVVNFSNIEHSDEEVERLDLDKIKYNW